MKKFHHSSWWFMWWNFSISDFSACQSILVKVTIDGSTSFCWHFLIVSKCIAHILSHRRKIFSPLRIFFLYYYHLKEQVAMLQEFEYIYGIIWFYSIAPSKILFDIFIFKINIYFMEFGRLYLFIHWNAVKSFFKMTPLKTKYIFKIRIFLLQKGCLKILMINSIFFNQIQPNYTLFTYENM